MTIYGYRDDDGDTCEAIKPKLTMNPLTQRVFQCISDRALNPDSILPDMEPGLATMIEPSPTLVALCSSALTTIKVTKIISGSAESAFITIGTISTHENREEEEDR